MAFSVQTLFTTHCMSAAASEIRRLCEENTEIRSAGEWDSLVLQGPGALGYPQPWMPVCVLCQSMHHGLFHPHPHPCMHAWLTVADMARCDPS